MIDEPTGPADEIDPGEPLTDLELLVEPPGERFLERLRGKIERRTLTSNVIVLAWTATATVVLEFVQVVFQVFDGDRSNEGDSK